MFLMPLGRAEPRCYFLGLRCKKHFSDHSVAWKGEAGDAPPQGAQVAAVKELLYSTGNSGGEEERL